MVKNPNWNVPLTSEQLQTMERHTALQDAKRRAYQSAYNSKHKARLARLTPTEKAAEPKQPPAWKVVVTWGHRHKLIDPATGDTLFATREAAQAAIDRVIAKFGYEPVSFNLDCKIKGVK